MMREGRSSGSRVCPRRSSRHGSRALLSCLQLAATCKGMNLSWPTSLPLRIVHRPFWGGGVKWDTWCFYQSDKQHLITCSSAEVRNHSLLRDGITLFVYLCMLYLRRADMPPPTTTSTSSLPCQRLYIFINYIIKDVWLEPN